MRIHYYNIILFVAVLCFSACSSSRKIGKDSASEAKMSLWQQGECVASRTNIVISYGKDKKVKLGGSLRMKRDDVVQLNLTYVLGIQVGTLELTQDSILILSRATRQYAVLDYPELSLLLGRKIVFDDFQSIFWGESSSTSIGNVKWRYDSFSLLPDERKLPSKIEFTHSKNKNAFSLSLGASAYSYDADWNQRTKINTSNYTRLTTEQAINIVTLLLEEL